MRATEETMKESKRQSNIEFLRALLMFMVIVLHYNNAEMGGGFAAASGTSLMLLKWMETLCICAVNCFVLISAYFMSSNPKRTWIKPVHLLAMVSGYNLLSYLLQIFVTRTAGFDIRTLIMTLVPANWFVVLFRVLYGISPYINVLFEHLDKKQLQRCIVLCLILFSVYPTVLEIGAARLTGSAEWLGLGTVTMSSSMGGYTIVNFVLMYLIGGYLRKYPVKLGKLPCLGVFLAASVIDYGISFFSSNYTSYANPLVIVQAVALFWTVKQWKLKPNRIINGVAKSSFGIYLLHTSSFMLRDVWGKFYITEYVRKTPGIVLCHLLAACVSMYLLCLVIDFVCRNIVSPLVNKIEKVLL